MLALPHASTGPLGGLPRTANVPLHCVAAHSGDGCLQEGVSAEASSLAGHLGLGRLIVLYDDNHITIDGETHLSFTEDVLARYAAYGWHTQHVPDGDHDFNGTGLDRGVAAARWWRDRTVWQSDCVRVVVSVHSSPLYPR